MPYDQSAAILRFWVFAIYVLQSCTKGHYVYAIMYRHCLSERLNLLYACADIPAARLYSMI